MAKNVTLIVAIGAVIGFFIAGGLTGSIAGGASAFIAQAMS